MHQQFTDKFSVIVCKATRKPIIFESDLTFADAKRRCDDLYNTLIKINYMTASGIALMIVDMCYNDIVSSIETGNLTYFNIEVEAQYGTI